MALTKTQISELYVSIFNRASEKSGSQNWLNSGYNTDATTMANAMLATDAAKTYFGTSLVSDAAFVEHIYANTLNKGGATVDAAGKAGWVEFLKTGASRGEMVAKMIEAIKEYQVGGAKYATADQTTKDAAQQFANRVDVSDYTADTLETIAVSEIDSTLSFSSALTVTANPATVITAKKSVQDLAIDGKTFTLTTGVDTFTGTDKADLFKAALLTVNDGDTLDGGAGVDTLNAEINAEVTDKFKSSNIEKVNVTSFGAQTVNMKNITGVETITTKGSTGKLTLNNVATSTVGFGFEGNSTNDITANHVAGALAGTNDILNVNLNGAKEVALNVAAGFESAKITTAGTNDVTTLTAPGVTTYTVEGTGSVNFKNTLANVTTVSATNNSGAITTGTVNATTGFVDQAITAGANGASVLLGAGNDNIGFSEASVVTGKSSTVKLGAGDDKALLNVSGNGATYVFGEAGNDTIKVGTGSLTASDLIDGGEGTDTLVLAAAGNNTMVLRGIEKLTLTSAATGTQTINSADSAIAVTAQVSNNVVNLADLTAGSTVKVETEANAATKTATAVTVGFKAQETASTIDVASGMTGALTLSKITAATVNLGAASDLGANINTSDVQSLTINATGALSTTTARDIVDGTTTDVLKTVTVTGTDLVKVGTVTSTVMETVNVTAAKALTVGNIGADSTKLTTVNLTSTTDGVTAAAIGSATNTETLNVTINAAKDITQTGAINSTKVGNISATSTAGKVTLGTIGASATTMGDVTVNAKGDATTSGAIGTVANLKTLGTVSMTSTDGFVALNAVDANDSTGITVNLSGKTFISKDGADAGADGIADTAAVVTNKGGNITATLAGAANAKVDYTVTTSKGIVNLTATNTGGLTSTVTNVGTIADALTSTITLGNAVSGKSNTVTVDGTVATLNVTGGTGEDNITISGQVKSGTIALGTGTDSVNFTGIDGAAGAAGTAAAGVVINLGSTAYKIDAGKSYETSVAAGHAVEYNAAAGATAKKLVTDGFDLTLSGVEKVTGTANADIIIANAEGSTITGGTGADIIVANAGVDYIRFTKIADANQALGTDVSAAKIDVISNFTAGNTATSDNIELGLTAAAFGTGITFTTATVMNVSAAQTLATADYADLAAVMTALESASNGVASTSATAQAIVFTLVADNTTANDFDSNSAGTYLVINDNNANWTAADTIIKLDGLVGTISAGDFTFVA